MRVPVVARADWARLSQLKAAIASLNASQSQIHFELMFSEHIPMSDSNQVISPTRTRSDLLANLKLRNSAACVTDCQFDNHWFSITSSSGTLITTHGWEPIFTHVPLKIFLQMELILHVIACAADLTDEQMEAMSHNNAIGCLFDFCENKLDIRFKFLAGHLCSQCAYRLGVAGVTTEVRLAINILLENMRLDAIGSRREVDPNQVFIVMEFSDNDENYNAYRHGVTPALGEMGFTAIRADTVAGSGILLHKILEMIDKSWAVVVLSERNNPNVFLEFGYALGKGKLIYLITPSNAIATTPTDIKGLEHIVYRNGNFEGLRDQIRRQLAALPRFSRRPSITTNK